MKKTLLFLLFTVAAQAQLNINNLPSGPTSNLTPTQLVNNVLLGKGVIASNIKFNGSSLNAGVYCDQAAEWKTDFTPINIGFPINQSGIILTTGIATGALGPNNLSGATSTTVLPSPPISGDADLALLSGGKQIRNVAILEFDFVATGLSLNIDYVFGSEEYPEYAPPNNASFNDVFGFFLSGPGITGPYSNNAKNIALIPGTNTGVSINNVNAVTNSQYYVSNTKNDTQYDGFTTVLRAASDLQCGDVYHIKLAIANVQDNALDSGVFLKNFTCPPMTIIDSFGFNSNSTLCDGQIDTLKSEITVPGATFVWKKDDEVIPNEIGPDLIITTSGTYHLDAFTSYGCLFGSDSIVITYLPPLPINDPKDIVITQLLPPYTINIDQTAAILGSQPANDYHITYYDSSYDDAFNNTSSGFIPTAKLATYTSTIPNQTIWVRIEDMNVTGCVIIKSFTITVTQSLDILKLVAFVDENNNSIKDNNEVSFVNGSFVYRQNNIGSSTSITSPSGTYDFYDVNPANTYDFSYQINSEYALNYTVVTTDYNDINIPVGSGAQTLYFPIKAIQSYNDVSIAIVPSTPPRPGFLYYNTINYSNSGTTTASGTLTFIKDPKATITYVDQAGITITPTGFTYDFTNLAYNETRSIGIAMSVPSIPTVSLNEILTNSANVTVADDINIANNSFSIAQKVVGSYDPNDITEAHGEKIPFNEFTQDDYLYYTIRFQNTGTAEAIDITVEEALNTKLDETSIRMVSASHDYIMERVNNQLSWSFKDINLVGSVQNEALSHGYVTFKIKPKAGFKVGDIIPNAASIYFDFNPAIVTNEFQTEFTAALSNPSFDRNAFLLYPNPTNTSVQINSQNNETIKNIVVYDVLGKTVKAISNLATNQTTVDVSNLTKGVYMVEITSDTDLKSIKKLIIE